MKHKDGRHLLLRDQSHKHVGRTACRVSGRRDTSDVPQAQCTHPRNAMKGFHTRTRRHTRLSKRCFPRSLRGCFRHWSCLNLDNKAVGARTSQGYSVTRYTMRGADANKDSPTNNGESLRGFKAWFTVCISNRPTSSNKATMADGMSFIVNCKDSSASNTVVEFTAQNPQPGDFSS